MHTSITWDKKLIEASRKSNNYKNSIFPDTVLWGMEINGVYNPSVAEVLKAISQSVNDCVPAKKLNFIERLVNSHHEKIE